MHIRDMIARWRLARRETRLYIARVSYRFGCAEKDQSVQLTYTTVTCPWHKAQYDLKTGGVLTPPAPQGVASYKVVVEGDDVSIEL